MSILEATVGQGTGRSQFDGLGKDWYGRMWEEHVNSKVEVLKIIGKVRGKMGGRRVLTAVIDGYPQSAGVAHLEYADITKPKSLSAFQPELITRSVYTRLSWTGQVEDMARAGDKAAFAGPRATEMRLARKQYMINKARMAYLGPRQILGKVASATAGGVLTMYSRNSRTSAAADWFKFGTHYLRKNMPIWVIGSSITDAPDTPSEQIALSGTGGTVASPTATFDSAPAVVADADDYVIPFGSRQATNTGVTAANRDSAHAGYNGLVNMVIDETLDAYLYGLDKTVRTTLAGQAVLGDTPGTPQHFDEDRLSLLLDTICDDGPGEEPDHFLTSRHVRREIVQDNKGDRRFAPVQTESGYGRLQFTAGDKTIPYHSDRDCPPGLIWALRKGTFGYLRNRAMGPIDKGPERFVDGKDVHEVILAERGNFFCTAPWGNGVLDDISYSTSAVTALPS